MNPENPSSILMALAVSYTNESYQTLACQTLGQWIGNQPQYASLPEVTALKAPAAQPVSSTFMSSELHEKTSSALIAAARMNSDIDADVQCGLGILFNLSGDYEKAVDCFKAALQVKPDDALMWNKLGATLANGNKSEEAVNAYHNALRISPGFVRARYNLGISCINLKVTFYYPQR